MISLVLINFDKYLSQTCVKKNRSQTYYSLFLPIVEDEKNSLASVHEIAVIPTFSK